MEKQSSNNADDQHESAASSTSQDKKEQPHDSATATDSTNGPTIEEKDEGSSGQSEKAAGTPEKATPAQDEVAQPSEESTATTSTKNPAAVSLGRLGGLKGGKARARSLTRRERSDAARKAARARWRKKEKPK